MPIVEIILTSNLFLGSTIIFKLKIKTHHDMNETEPEVTKNLDMSDKAQTFKLKKTNKDICTKQPNRSFSCFSQ